MSFFRPRSYEEMRELLLKDLRRGGYVKSDTVEDAMRRVPREEFLPKPSPEKAYEDSPQLIGSGQTISAPHMVAIMCEAMELKEGMRVMEIGSGGGYHAAVVAEIIGDGGCVVSAEIVPDLADYARSNIEKVGLQKRVEVVSGDGVKVAMDRKPFDRIYLAAAAPDISDVLVPCLGNGGILLMPVGLRYFSELIRYRKIGDEVKSEHLGGCAFVPLTGEYGR